MTVSCHYKVFDSIITGQAPVPNQADKYVYVCYKIRVSLILKTMVYRWRYGLSLLVIISITGSALSCTTQSECQCWSDHLYPPVQGQDYSGIRSRAKREGSIQGNPGQVWDVLEEEEQASDARSAAGGLDLQLPDVRYQGQDHDHEGDSQASPGVKPRS